MVDFPEDVIIDILLRLPSKTLVRSRCVSKYWNTLITSTSFIKAHLHRASKPCHLLYQDTVISEINLNRKTISKMKIRFSGCNELTNIDDPPPSITDVGFDNFKLVDSFNGIACLYAVNERTSTSRIWLWNPAINDCFTLPEPRYPISSIDYCCVGFGFNPLSSHIDDFKVVTITEVTVGEKRIEIYSRRTNSWKELVGYKFYNWRSSQTSNQVIFEEYICWSPLLRRWNGNIDMSTTTMVSFNVVTEEFREMAIPDSVPCYGWDFITLLDGCVSLLVPYLESYTKCYEVWTMKEFGNIESWSKLYNINAFSSVGSSRPLGFASTDEAIFLCCGFLGTHSSSSKDMRSYDTRTRTFDRSKTIRFDFSFVDCCFVLYMESLIPVS